MYVLFKNSGNSIQRWWLNPLKYKNLTITKVPWITFVYIHGNINWYGCWRCQVINHLCPSCYTNRIIYSTSPWSIDQQQVRLFLPTPMSSWRVHLRYWGRDKMAAISQTTLSDEFSCMKIHELRLIFHWALFLRVQLTIFQHWFR